MWKEEYRIGIDLIDEQHKELFRMVQELIKTVTSDKEGVQKETYKEAISFLKRYVIQHFKEEEEYQSSIQYPDRDKHKKIHRQFSQKVAEHEKKLIETDFDKNTVKNFVGMLTAWLVYHVADEDQKIAGKTSKAAGSSQGDFFYTLKDAALAVFEPMLGLKAGEVYTEKGKDTCEEEDILISVDLFGDFKGALFFYYSQAFSFGMVKALTAMEVTAADEFVYSALSELSNIISGSVTVAMEEIGMQSDIKAPCLMNGSIPTEYPIEKMDTIQFKTKLGCMKISMKKYFS